MTLSRITLSLISKLLIGGGLLVCFLIHPIWLSWLHWRASGASTHSVLNPSSSSTPATIQASERLLLLLAGSAAPNSRGQLPVRLNSLGDENSLSFSLSFDPAKFSDPQVELESEYSEAFLEVNTSQVGNGRLGIRFILPDGGSFQAGVRNILQVSFAIAPDAGAGPEPIEMGDAPVARRIRDADGAVLPVRYGDGTMVIVPGIEADVAPPGNEDGEITEDDWTRIGLFAVAGVAPETGSEFQRADCAPRAEKGNGRLTVADWAQARRFLDGLDEPAPAGGPSVPADPGPATCVPDGLQRTLRVKEAVFLRGAENRLEIELESSGEENAIGFTLSFDPTQLGYVRAIAAADAEVATLNINMDRAAQGMIGVGLALPSGQKFASGLRKLLNVFFSVPPTSSVNRTTVSFDDSLAVSEMADTSAKSLCANFVAGVVTFTPQVNEPPKLTGLEPPVVFVGGTELTLLLNGEGFVTASVAQANGAARATAFISGNRLRMTLLPQDVAGVGTIVITVMNPGEGGGVSNPLDLFVAQRALGDNLRPSLFGITPMVVAEGSLPFTLKLTGNGFALDSVVRIKGQDRMTRFVSQTQLEATVAASDVAVAGEVPVHVFNPPPGGGMSNELKLIVKKRNPLPRIVSLSLEENPAGGFTLTVNGTNFVQEAKVLVNGSSRTRNFVSASKLTVNLSTQEIATAAGTLIVIVENPPPGGGKSFPFSLSIGDLGLPTNQAPFISSIVPNMVAEGSLGFLLQVNGSGFVPGAVVLVDGRARATNFVSATQLTAEIHASDVAEPASLAVRVANPDSGGRQSLAATLVVKKRNPDPRIADVTLTMIAGQTRLLVTGSNFVQGSVGRVNGSSRSTAFDSSTTLRITPSAQDLATAGTINITVFNPPPGGGVSNTFDFVVDDPVITVNPSPPSISQIKPNLVSVGAPAFTLLVNGSNFKVGSVVRFNNRARATKFVNAGQLTTLIFPSDIAVPGGIPVEVITPEPAGGRSNSAPLAVRIRNPAPQIASIAPDAVNSGAKEFQLQVNGMNFVNGSAVLVNGVARPTSFVSSNELSVTISSSEISRPGRVDISVATGQPGGGATGPIGLVVGDPVNPQPSITSITPNPVAEGSAAFTLKVTGARFMTGSVVRVNGIARATTFVDSAQLTAMIPASDVARTGSLTIQVFNSEPGGGLSNSVILEVKKRNPVPRIESLSVEVVNAGEAGFTLTVNGSNFARGASVRIRGVSSATTVSRSATFVSSRQLSVQILPQDIARAGLVDISVFNPLPGGGASNIVTLIVQ
jgi:hypothetical protein